MFASLAAFSVEMEGVGIGAGMIGVIVKREDVCGVVGAVAVVAAPFEVPRARF